MIPDESACRSPVTIADDKVVFGDRRGSLTIEVRPLVEQTERIRLLKREHVSRRVLVILPEVLRDRLVDDLNTGPALLKLICEVFNERSLPRTDRAVDDNEARKVDRAILELGRELITPLFF